MAMELNSINPELQTHKITMTPHAYERASERLGLKNKSEALGNIRGYLRQATRIGRVKSEDGVEAILYAHGRIAIYLSLDLSTVITLYKSENVTYVPIKTKVVDIHKKEFNKLERLEKSKKRKLYMEKLRVNVEISQLEYRKAKTKSENVKIICDENVKSLRNYIKILEDELEEIQGEKRQIAKSMVSLL